MHYLPHNTRFFTPDAPDVIVIAAGNEKDKPINDGVSRMSCLRGYEPQHHAEGITTVKLSFARALKAAKGAVPSIPLWIRQIAVFFDWIDFGELTDAGKRVIAEVAKAELETTEVQRDMLHEKAQARKEAARIDGAERQRAFNEAQAAAAKARREEEEKERIARRERRRQWRAALDFAQASAAASESTWVPNAVPVLAWLRPESALALQAYASASGKTLSAAVQDILERATT